MADIHPTSIVGSSANIGNNVEIGAFAIVEDGAVVGNNCVIGPHALVTRWARIGNDVKIHNGAVVGTDPQDLKFEGEDTTLEVGDRTVVREFATLNRGTNASGKTTIGSDCLIMAYAHVAHDCHLGNHVIQANSVNMGGHVEIGDWVILGGMAAIHQFVRIGDHAMVGGGWRVPSDVPPFVSAAGEPLTYKGVNAIGLKRRGFSPETLHTIQDAYRLIYRKGLNISQALENIKNEVEQIPEVQEIVSFIEARELRGLMK